MKGISYSFFYKLKLVLYYPGFKTIHLKLFNKEHLCKAFEGIEEHFPDDFSFEQNGIFTEPHSVYHTSKGTWNVKRKTTGQAVSAATVLLFNKLFTGNKHIKSENKNNEYITYIILWLSNKMKLIEKGNYGSVADFYAAFIRDSGEYNAYIDKINKSQNIMNLKIYRIRKLYELLNDLCNAITKYTKDPSICRNPSNCPDFFNFVNNWEKESKQLLEKKTKVFEDEDYCDVLLTLKNAYEKYKEDNHIKNKLPEIEEIEELRDCKKLRKEAKNSSKVKGLMPQDLSRYIDIVKNPFKKYSSFFSIMLTNNDNNLHKKLLQTLKFFYCKLKKNSGITIDNMNESLKKVIEKYGLDNCTPEEKVPGDETPSDSDPPSSQEDLPQDNSSQSSSPSSLPLSSDKQTNTLQSSSELSKKTNSNKEDQGGLNKPVLSPVIKLKNPIFKVKINGIPGIYNNVLKKYKPFVFSFIFLLIPIALVIMYKYLPFGWGKKLKKKKKKKRAINMFGVNETEKRVINSTDRKKQAEMIINSSTQKKQDEKFINSYTQKKQDEKFINSYTQKKKDEEFINSYTQKKKDENKKFINSTDRKKQVEIIINSSTQKKQDKKFINSSTQKKKDKKFTNLSTQKKQDKKLTNSSTQKKQTEQIINSIYWKKYPLLNIYKLMKTDPLPFFGSDLKIQYKD
ncbi:hypothetical protein YYC_01120 [Plasmodium yoelii 17X]|uniref:Uncharacterized protein n=1 Tax=Plasmodium yoelii 17X TaxID=1323249 RepID=V7PSL6_PLAYE|nr:hypothetical protein YYC_01120 [Plasmodium yoelii 17X]